MSFKRTNLGLVLDTGVGLGAEPDGKIKVKVGDNLTVDANGDIDGPAPSATTGQGTAIASAATIALPADTNDTFVLTGNALVGTITPGGRTAGALVTFIFNNAGFAAGGGTVNTIRTLGGGQLPVDSGLITTITFRLANLNSLGGANVLVWNEVSRSINDAP